VKVLCLVIVSVNVIGTIAAEISNMTDLWLSGVFFSSSKYSKTGFQPGLRPGPRWGSLRRSPRLPSRLGPIPFPLDAFGVSISAPKASVVRPSNTNSWLRLWRRTLSGSIWRNLALSV